MATYLTRTPSSTGNRDKWTFSTWLKRSKLGATNCFFSGNDGSNSLDAKFRNDDVIEVYNYLGGGYGAQLKTNRAIRDTSAWYHIVLVYDSGNSTEAHRLRIYVNGEEESSFSTTNYPSLNEDSIINASGVPMDVGRQQNGSDFFLGYLADTILADGQAYAPNTFGETDSATGEWKPKSISGVTFGTNGFHLKYANAGAMGTDSSGNNNTLTVNSAGTNPSTTDTPSNNFATWNSLVVRSFQYPLALTEGNLKVIADSNASFGSTVAAIVSLDKGKWYWEFKYTTSGTGGYVVGWGEDTYDFDYQSDAYPYKASLGSTSGVFYRADGGKIVNGTETGSAGASWSQNDVIGVAVDLDNGNITFYKNGSSQFSETSVFTSTLSYYPEFYGYGSKGGQANFGNPSYTIASGNADANGHGNFEYAVPSGYFALCTKNINTYG